MSEPMSDIFPDMTYKEFYERAYKVSSQEGTISEIIDILNVMKSKETDTNVLSQFQNACKALYKALEIKESAQQRVQGTGLCSHDWAYPPAVCPVCQLPVPSSPRP